MDKISAALVKAQRGFAPALKTSTNPHFRSRYADLSACVEAVIDSLNANGIALIQRQHPSEGGVAVETVFVHESGEQLSAGILHVPASKQDPQGYGSALTYARRYSLMAACGIAPEDDDGNAASKKTTTAHPPAKLAAEDTPIDPSVRAYVEEIGADIVAAWTEGNELAALKAWRSISDNDIKIHVWSWLSGESKLRAFLKANKAA